MADLSALLRLLQQERHRLSAQLEGVNRALVALKGGGASRKRSLSAAAIARIRAAQKARWAKWRKTRKSK